MIHQIKHSSVRSNTVDTKHLIVFRSYLTSLFLFFFHPAFSFHHQSSLVAEVPQEGEQ